MTCFLVFCNFGRSGGKINSLGVKIAVETDQSQTNNDEPHIPEHFMYAILQYLHVFLGLFPGFLADPELVARSCLFEGKFLLDSLLDFQPETDEPKAYNTVQKLGQHEGVSVAQVEGMVIADELNQQRDREDDAKDKESNVEDSLSFYRVNKFLGDLQHVEIAHQVDYHRLYYLSNNQSRVVDPSIVQSKKVSNEDSEFENAQQNKDPSFCLFICLSLIPTLHF